MLHAHTQGAAVLLRNGWVLEAGGRTADAEVYEPIRNAWVATGTMTVARTNGTGTLLADGDVLVTGGGVNTAETYVSGRGPLVVLAPRTVRFGATEVGSTSKTRTFTVTNEGDGGLHVAGLGISGSDPGDFSAAEDCPTDLHR